MRQGQVIAYVGDTGNAGAGNYHLHFSIAAVSDPKRYWEGTNINPYPLLQTVATIHSYRFSRSLIVQKTRINQRSKRWNTRCYRNNASFNAQEPKSIRNFNFVYNGAVHSCTAQPTQHRQPARRRQRQLLHLRQRLQKNRLRKS